MAFSYGFFNAKNLDRTYTAENFCDYLGSIICNGIQDNYGQCFELTQNNLKLTIGSGKAWIDGHYFISDTAYTFDLSSYVNESLPRYVSIGICCNTGENYRSIGFEVLAGTPATSPSIPEFQNTDDKTYLTLCTVMIYACATELSVIDYRENENYCGYVKCILGKCKVSEMLAEISDIKQEIDTLQSVTNQNSESIKETKNYLFNTADKVTFEKDDSGNFMYKLPDGTYATGEQKISGIPYKFDSNGILQTGWQTVSGKQYYYNPKTGNISLGWIEYENNRYYVTLMDGKLVSQYRTINGKRYWFNESGITTDNHFIFPDVDGDGFITSSDASIVTDFYSKASAGKYTNDVDGWEQYIRDKSEETLSVVFPDIDDDGVITSADTSIITDFYSKASSGEYTNDSDGWQKYINDNSSDTITLSETFPDLDSDGIITSADASTITDFYSKASSGEYTNNEAGWKKYISDKSSITDTQSVVFPDIDGDGIITSSDASIITDFYSKASAGEYTNDINGWEQYISNNSTGTES